MSVTRNCDDFYRQRDLRNVEYLSRAIDDLTPVHVAIGPETAATASGQLALLALANQVVRTTRRVTFAIPDPATPVLVSTPFEGSTLGAALLSTVTQIDPCGEFALADRPPGCCLCIGLGDDVRSPCEWFVGADHAIAYLRQRPTAFTDRPATLRGAALASCLGAAAVLRTQLGQKVSPRRLSAWNYGEGEAAEPGPATLARLDVGRALVVGAGAVGASLGYWLKAFGMRGDGWAMVDGDEVMLHNINRGMLFTAAHAAWRDGTPAMKAELLAHAIQGSTPYSRWYHDCPELSQQRFDVVLALANDYGARQSLTQRHSPLAFQATTGDNWLSQLHRHILGKDGCIWCRTGEVRQPVFGCSSGQMIAADGSRNDAALPFLSAASGLMLATALERMVEGDFANEPANCWSWDFGSEYRMTPRPAARRCSDSCAFVPSRGAQRKLVAGSRWAHLVEPKG